MMPGIDGQEVLKIIREKEKQAGILPAKEVKVLTNKQRGPGFLARDYCGEGV
jgi:CheY-like chemotaxis protein